MLLLGLTLGAALALWLGRRRGLGFPVVADGLLAAAIGGLLLVGDAGVKVLELSQYLWPIALIVVGLAIILRRYMRSS